MHLVSHIIIQHLNIYVESYVTIVHQDLFLTPSVKDFPHIPWIAYAPWHMFVQAPSLNTQLESTP